MGRLILPNNQQEKKAAPAQETGILGQLGQGALDAVSAIAGLPGSIINPLLESGKNSEFAKSVRENRGGNVIEPGRLPTSPELVSGARRITGHTAPQTTAQKFAYNAGGFIPGVAATIASGGAAAPALASATGATLGQTAAQELGLGTVGEIAFSIIGGGLGSSLARSGTKGIVEKIIPLQKSSYKTAEKLGKNININASELGGHALFNPELNKLATNSLSGPVYSKYLKQFTHDKNNIIKSINKNGGISLNRLVDLKKQFNDIIYDKDTPVRVKTVYNRAKDLLLKELDVVGKKYPEWGKEFQRGENLTTFIKGSERFKDFFRNHKELEGLLTELPSEVMDVLKKIGNPKTLPHLLFKAGTAPVAAPIKYAAKELKNARELFSNPATANLLEDLYKGIAQDNVGIVARSLLSLTGNAEESSNQTSQHQRISEKAQGKGRLILP